MKLDISVHDILESKEAVVLRIKSALYCNKCSQTLSYLVALENYCTFYQVIQNMMPQKYNVPRLTPFIKKLANLESGNTKFPPPLIMQANKVLIFLVRKTVTVARSAQCHA